MGSINNLSSNYIQSILNSTSPSSPGSTTSNANNTNAASLLQAQADNGGLSPFAQMMSTLQQLQQSNPAEYQQVTKQIATNLQSAAQTAQADGNTSQANELNKLATDFSNASQNNQLPNIQDLASAIGGHHHHHHHGGGGGASSSSSSDASSSDSSSSSTANPLAQILASFQSNSTQNDALNPMSIITSTLQSAGIGASNS
jgi:hypothetical protein